MNVCKDILVSLIHIGLCLARWEYADTSVSRHWEKYTSNRALA